MAEKFIQQVFENAKKKGTEGKCTGAKYGSSSCPEGSQAYNFAKLLHRFASERHARAKNKGMK